MANIILNGNVNEVRTMQPFHFFCRCKNAKDLKNQGWVKVQRQKKIPGAW